MIDSTHLSPVVCLLMEDGREIEFKLYRHDGEINPSSKECKGRIRKIRLSYAFCGEQDFGIESLEDNFKVKKNGIITKIPKDLEVITNENVKAIRYGELARTDPLLERYAKDTGVIGYWDDANLFICASHEYGFVIDEIYKLFCPKHVKFALKANSLGYDLIILAA